MESYKQKYERALEQAKQELRTCSSLDCDAARQILRIFPELKESEDESIRKEIIHLIKKSNEYGGYALHKDEADRMISWLEKQNKQQARTGNEWVNTIDNACNHRYAEEYAHGEYCHEQSFKWGFQEGVDWLEKHQICDMPKIEFKVGDWVIFKGGIHASVYKVEKLENYEYTLEHFLGGSMPLPFGNQSLLRPWTIQDAKNGDILVNKSRTFIYREYDDSSIGYYASFYPRGRNKLLFNGAFFITPDIIKDIYPATKEQRDLLFQKIEEAGYEWDNNKKELIKHEQ